MFGFSTVLGSYSHVIDGKNDSLVGKMIFRWWEDEKKIWRSEPRGGESEIKPFSERGLFFFWFPCSFLLALWLFVISRLISTTYLEGTLFCADLTNFFFVEDFQKILMSKATSSSHHFFDAGPDRSFELFWLVKPLQRISPAGIYFGGLISATA